MKDEKDVLIIELQKYIEELREEKEALQTEKECWGNEFNSVIMLKQELSITEIFIRKSLERIIAMAGHPDAAQGCRDIIAYAKSSLGVIGNLNVETSLRLRDSSG